MKLIRTLLLLAFPIYLISCSTQKKLPDYIQNVNDTTGKGIVRNVELRIQKNDMLSIQVYSASTMPEKSDAIYNLRSSGGSSTETSAATGGFLVDAAGNIEYPQIGLVHAEGLTKQQLADTIKARINAKEVVLINPVVIIRFQNIHVTILGEVTNQGVINIPGEKVTILQAVGLAGGINEYGLKNTVKVIREIDGQRSIGTIDLSSKDIFESDYYNLMQNDVVLVETSDRKIKKAQQDAVVQKVSFGLSLITAIALLYNIFK